MKKNSWKKFLMHLSESTSLIAILVSLLSIVFVIFGRSGYLENDIFRSFAIGLSSMVALSTIGIFIRNTRKQIQNIKFSAKDLDLYSKMLKDKYKIFISYSQHDSNFVTQLNSELNAKTPRYVFYTGKDALLLGDNIKEKLSHTIDDSDFCIVVISPTSNTKYVKFEYELMKDKEKPIIPIVLRENKSNDYIPADIKEMYYLSIEPDTKNQISYAATSIINTLDKSVLNAQAPREQS